MEYKIVFDNGKPYVEECDTEGDLKQALKEFFIKNRVEDMAYCDAFVYNENEEDISDSQFIVEMVADIVDEIECEVKI